MLPPQEIEDVLERFRDWLTTANEELDAADVRALAEQLSQGAMAGAATEVSNGSVGLLQVVETVTALRHDLKLQNKSVRSLRETTEVALEGLQRASEQFDRNQKDAERAAEQAVRPFVEKLLTLDELIGQAESSIGSLSSHAEEPPVDRIERELSARYLALPRWRRAAAAFWQRVVCDVLKNHRQAPRTGMEGLVEGLRLLRTRASAALADVGVERIECVGRRVDPAAMRVVDVAEAAGRPPETVVEEVRPGYTFRGNVVRFAEVRATRGG